MDLRWSRGCGTGVGLSGHKNEYPPVVAINNFLEDRAGAGDSKWHKFGKVEPAESTYQRSHNRTAEQIAAALGNCTAKIPPEPLTQNKGKTILFEHLGPRQAPPDAFVSLNSLTYSTPHLDKRKTQKELWCGAKAIDLKVTQKVSPSGRLTANKSSTWASHQTPERATKYSSTSRSAQMRAALLSDARKRECGEAAAVFKASAGSGCLPTVGRKVTGDMCDWIDRKERFINVLDARKPINYTVTLTCKHASTGDAEEVDVGEEPHAIHSPHALDAAEDTVPGTNAPKVAQQEALPLTTC